MNMSAIPNRPVPYVGYTVRGMIAEYVTEDQRFASERPDVLVYQTEPLDHDLIVTGPIKINLNVAHKWDGFRFRRESN